VLPEGDVCLEVMTGAVLPSGCDCVVPVERIKVQEGWVELPPDLAIEPGMNVHTRGLDSRAGEPLLGPGVRLGAPELAVLASAGLSHARVRAEPRIMIVTTGDELVEPGLPIEPWQIRRSNAHALRAALAMHGFARSAEDHLADDPREMLERLARHLDTHDVLVLTGGVSMGRFDHVPAVLQELGVRQVLHRVAQRPGKPLWFGISGRGQAVYGLPGNPVSALICLLRYVVPGLLAASGAPPARQEEIRLGTAFEVRPPLTFFLPVRLESQTGQGSVAMPQPTHGSGDFVSLLGTQGFVELPPGPRVYPAGYVAPFYRW
jgi:molybdopterin molybdotransferase